VVAEVGQIPVVLEDGCLHQGNEQFLAFRELVPTHTDEIRDGKVVVLVVGLASELLLALGLVELDVVVDSGVLAAGDALLVDFGAESGLTVFIEEIVLEHLQLVHLLREQHLLLMFVGALDLGVDYLRVHNQTHILDNVVLLVLVLAATACLE